jgi:hypothetical protein
VHRAARMKRSATLARPVEPRDDRELGVST